MLSSSLPSPQYPLLDTTPRPLTPSRLPEAVWESATYICIMKSTFKAPTHPRTDFCINKGCASPESWSPVKQQVTAPSFKRHGSA